MILWLLVLIVLGCVGVVGYFQGAIRVACSLVGLLVAAPLAVPLGGALKPILRLLGIDHPVSLAILAPFIVFVILMAGVKVGAQALHQRIDRHFKYKVSDTERLLFERMQQRVGVALAMANGFIYVVLLSIIFYVLGYFTFQLSTPESSSFAYKIANQLAKDIQSTKMTRAISGLAPAPERYYVAVDILGDIYQNPTLQSRLSSYPAFYGLAERQEFVTLASDKKFQDMWLKTNPRPPVKTFWKDARIQPLVESVDFYTNVLGLLNNDLTDFKAFLETGKSQKYDDQVLLGYWYYDYGASLKRAQRGKINMAPAEIVNLRQSLGVWSNAVLKVYADNRVTLKAPAGGGNAAQNFTGTWREENSSNFQLSLKDGKKDLEAAASVEQTRLVVQKGNEMLYFER
jgi:hypothetical protein